MLPLPANPPARPEKPQPPRAQGHYYSWDERFIAARPTMSGRTRPVVSHLGQGVAATGPLGLCSLVRVGRCELERFQECGP
jgi:hypothetical protein